jgi:membrane fusion protein (multidrug efflux system)
LTAGLLASAVLIGLWLLWFVFSGVVLYEVSDAARLEVAGTAHPVASPVDGRVVASRLVLGHEVRSGDVLVELETQALGSEVEEKRRNLAGLASRIEAIVREIADEERSRDERQRSDRAATEETRARFEQAKAAVGLAEQEAQRQATLHAAGLLATAELQRAQAEAKQRSWAAEALRLGLRRQEAERRGEASGHQARVERLRGEQSRLEAEAAACAESIERLRHEVDRRAIRAPVGGWLGEVADLTVGSVVREGDKLGTVVPAGELRVAAHFLPGAAVGRIQPGQPARLRLKAFPWEQYGTIPAEVTSVASEPREQRVRVELALKQRTPSAIVLQHGLLAQVEVEVERVSPAALVLRIAGRQLAAHRAVEP